MNDAGAVTGFYMDASGNDHGFLRIPGGQLFPVDVPGGTNTFPTSINNEGMIAGSYMANGSQHGFVRDVWGGFTSFDPPGSVVTSPASMDAEGTIAGSYSDTTAVLSPTHGFVRSPQVTITTFDPPDSSQTSPQTAPQSLNAYGTAAGSYIDSVLGSSGFIRTRGGKTVSFEYPAGIGTGTLVWGINDFGAVTGTFSAPSYKADHSIGFLRIPAGICCSGKPVELTVEAGGLFWDGGGSRYGRTALQEYPDYPTAGQNWTWAPAPGGFTICTLGKVCLSDNGNQVVLSAKADVFTLSGTGAVLDMNTGQYIQNASQPGAYLSTGPTQSSWEVSFNLH